MKTPEELPNQSLARGLLILEQFTHQKREWGLRELSRKMGVNSTTIFRLVSTLKCMGYLEQGSDTGKIRLGPKLSMYANLYSEHNPLAGVAMSVFENFTDRFEYNFYLGKLHEGVVIYQVVLDGRGPIKVTSEIGGTIAIHASALGKVLLAFQDEDYIREFLKTHSLREFTLKTITDPSLFFEELQLVRKNGYSLNQGEFYSEIAAVGVPVYSNSNNVESCVSLAYPKGLVDEARVLEIIELAKEISREITFKSGRT